MFLKRIKIDGFKSFAKPIVIDFSAPITAIVGPNGCGKSNIVDAIKWAIGEQSAKSLRGSKMSDIIFAGSMDYRPVEKASVTLYFDNSERVLDTDKKEVRIKRCVTIDGQSEYYINGSPCRLKDIEELFMDTGLGREDYSIVSQGKIDSIINSRPEKLRELFEEAAGIVKYKTRKQEAENKLNRTREDLQRVKDLVWELEKQVNPVKKSAEKAAKYRRLRGELEVLEVNLLLDNWESNNKQLEEIRKNEEFFYNKIIELEKEISQRDKILEKETGELQDREEYIEKMRDNIYQTKSKLEQAENSLKVLAEREVSLLREKDNYNTQLNTVSDDLEKISEKKQSISSQLKEVEEEGKRIEAQILKIEEELSETKKELKKRKEELVVQRNSILDDNTETKEILSELEKYREKSRYLEIEIEKLAARRKNISEEYDDTIVTKNKILREINENELKLAAVEDELQEYGKRARKLEDNIDELNQSIQKLNNEINQDSSRLKLLQEMEADYQGYFQGVKSIMMNKEKLPGIIGVIADLINVDKKYELAIETALGAKIQNIVAEDDDTAKKAVNFLKSNKGGTATFIPLNMVRGEKARLNELNIDSEDGFLGLAADLIDYEERFTTVVESLLGKTIVAENLDKAVEISKKIKSSLRIVTLDGEFINTGGAITGGSTGNKRQGTLLGRSREIEELKSRLENSRKALAEQEKEILDKKEEMEKLLKIQEKKSEEKNKLEFRKNDLSKDLLNIEKEYERLDSELKIIDKDFEEYHRMLGENDKVIQQLEKKLADISDEQSREKEEINRKELEIKELEEREEENNRSLTEIKIALATNRQKRAGIIAESENYELEFEKLSRRKEEIEGLLDENEKMIEEIFIRKEELEEMKKGFQEKILELEDRYEEDKLSYEKFAEEVKRLQANFYEKQQELNRIKDDYHRIDLKKNRLEDKNIQIAERLREEYELSAEEGIPERIKLDNHAQASNKIKELKEAIKKLGPVNLTAVEEYEQLLNRLDYLKEQQKDLLEAGASIEKVIAELERGMSELFYQSFTEVREEFEKIFKILFNGGKAELRLTRPEDLLETGVEIEAQPPGKQLKKLTLMSGGERALTAIALVFAFLQVNPSPIYVLDEIDASLDDANVRRFADYLKEYSQHVQFILITHNKYMMTQSDVIYGITMEEKGVSKLVSLRLDEEIA